MSIAARIFWKTSLSQLPWQTNTTTLGVQPAGLLDMRACVAPGAKAATPIDAASATHDVKALDANRCAHPSCCFASIPTPSVGPKNEETVEYTESKPWASPGVAPSTVHDLRPNLWPATAWWARAPAPCDRVDGPLLCAWAERFEHCVPEHSADALSAEARHLPCHEHLPPRSGSNDLRAERAKCTPEPLHRQFRGRDKSVTNRSVVGKCLLMPWDASKLKRG